MCRYINMCVHMYIYIMYTYIVKGLFAHQVTAQAPNALFLDAWMPQTLTAAHP